MWDDYDGGFVGNGSRKRKASKRTKVPNLPRMFKSSRRRRRRVSSSDTFDLEGWMSLFWLMSATLLLITGLCETPLIYLYVYTILIVITVFQKNTSLLEWLTMGLMANGITICMLLAVAFLLVLLLDGDPLILLLGMAYFAGVPTLSLILCKFFNYIFYR